MRMTSISRLTGKAITIAAFLLVMPFVIFAQNAATNNIKGKVADSSGASLQGVTVKVKGKTLATTTDATGSFSITATNGEVLVFSYVGYTNKEITVSENANYSISLESVASALSDAVVVGYGRSTRRALTSSVVTLKPNDLNRGAISDVGQLMQGKVAGLNITSSGDPNRPAAVILRGASTVNSPGAPFYVIDGVPGADISTVAPDDIASLDVLKDAAATAIYGNRASNGVIMITTKRGRKGASQVSYNGYVGMEKVSNKLDMMNSDQLRSYLKDNGSAFSPNDDKGANTDWQAAIQRQTAWSQNHNLSFSGGGEHSTYSASVNYFDKQGIMLKSDLTRLITRLNIEQYALNDHLKLGLNLVNSNSNSSNTPLQNIVLLQAAKHLPVSPVKNPDGTYFENLNTTGYFNPVAMIDNATDETKYNSMIGNFTVELKLPVGFTFNTNINYQKNTALHGEYYGTYYGNYPTSNFYNNPDPGIGISHQLIGNLFGKNGSALRSSYENTVKTLESYLTWAKKFGDHSITAVAGYSWQENTYGDGFQVSSTNFPTDNTGYNNLALSNPYAIPSYRINLGNDLTYGQIRLISDFGRVNYNYKDKYLLQGSIRRDGSSVFGENNHWGYFPSVGAAWRISQEGFMANQKIFSDLKLRGSYGETGNSGGIGAYTSKLIYGVTGTFYNNGVQDNAFGPMQGANPNLRWERTATYDIGLDFSLFRGILSGSIDWYDKKTDGMLFDYAVPSSLVPGGQIWANGGSVSNKGIELSLNATAINKKDFSWNIGLNLAHNDNKITSLQGPLSNGDSIRYSDPEGPGQTGATLQILKVGYPIGQFFTLQYSGKNAGDTSVFLKHNGTTTTGPGVGTDYWYAGAPQPKLMIGFNNTFRYKNFDLNIFMRSVVGLKIFNATRADLSYVTAASQNNILVSAANDMMKDKNNSFYSTRYIDKADYLRLDNATLGYVFRNPIKNVSSIRLYASVNNLFTITSYNGIDPEINQGGVAPGIDYNNFYPKTRTVMFGVNVSF